MTNNYLCPSVVVVIIVTIIIIIISIKSSSSSGSKTRIRTKVYIFVGNQYTTEIYIRVQYMLKKDKIFITNREEEN